MKMLSEIIILFFLIRDLIIKIVYKSRPLGINLMYIHKNITRCWVILFTCLIICSERVSCSSVKILNNNMVRTQNSSILGHIKW